MAREFTTDRRRRPRHDGRRDRRGLRAQRLRRRRRRADRRGRSSAGAQHVEHSTDRAVKRGKLSEDEQQATLRPHHVHHRARGPARTATSSSRRSSSSSTLKQADLPAARRASSRPTPILATNTSSLSVTEISAATSHPGRVVGMHFFNPAPVQKFVEVIRTVVTEPDVLDDVPGARSSRLDKTPVVVRRQGRVHRQRPALRLPQPRGRRCTRATTPRARTSTRRCGSAAATRWARSRCST